MPRRAGGRWRRRRWSSGPLPGATSPREHPGFGLPALALPERASLGEVALVAELLPGHPEGSLVAPPRRETPREADGDENGCDAQADPGDTPPERERRRPHAPLEDLRAGVEGRCGSRDENGRGDGESGGALEGADRALPPAAARQAAPRESDGSRVESGASPEGTGRESAREEDADQWEEGEAQSRGGRRQERGCACRVETRLAGPGEEVLEERSDRSGGAGPRPCQRAERGEEREREYEPGAPRDVPGPSSFLAPARGGLLRPFFRL